MLNVFLISTLLYMADLTRAGQGVFTPPPPNSAPEPGNIVTRGKRHLNERQQALRNCCGHFLGQVKGQNTRA